MSTPRYGQEWGSDQMVTCLGELRELGANWVATHPYASIRDDGTVGTRIDPEAPPDYLTRPIREARARGMKILIKPHLAYWGSRRFSWRGEIDFGNDTEQWDRFWSGYESWIVGQARIAKDADAFCIGTELDRTLRFRDRWQRIIVRIREVTKAHLTYAANWTDYRRVPFWRDLDCIGIQAYFPLAMGPTESPDALRAGWRARMKELRSFSASHDDMPIVFTELGYPRAANAAVEPWGYRESADETARTTQLRCLDAALAAVDEEPVVVGAFLWKWFPRASRRDHNFKLQQPAVLDVIRGRWVR